MNYVVLGENFTHPIGLVKKQYQMSLIWNFVNSLITAYYDKTSIPRFLDPTCGSGIFLFMELNKYYIWRNPS